MVTATNGSATNGTAVLEAPGQVHVPAPIIEFATFRLEGVSPLICHRWSEKAKKEMLDKQMKKASVGKLAKDPDKDFRESLYEMPDGDGYGFPAIAFKAAMVRAGTYLDLKMTFLRGAFHIDGELIRIEGEPTMREDMVRVGMGTADIRYRGQFMPWAVDLPVRYNARAISLEQVANLIVTAGFSVGVGEWRPEKDGSYGLWELAS